MASVLEISTLFYQVEKDQLSTTKMPKIPNSTLNGVGNNGGGAWIASQDSIFFPVPAKYLQKGLKISVKFEYEWEISKQGLSINEPEHRVYFRGSDIGSANTGIEMIPCKK